MSSSLDVSTDRPDAWRNAPFSHQSAIRLEIDFLRTISDNVDLTVPGATLNNAIRRYETIWLPLLQYETSSYKSSKLVPPLDVHWVWHCHMLSPVNYRKDCRMLVGAVLDHAIRQPTADDISYSQQKWSSQGEQYTALPPANLSRPAYAQRSSYDLMAACVRQSEFHYNISLPHYKDGGFLYNAVQRYRKFLYLRKRHPGQFIVPCYDIDLVWHTHQLHPLDYASDTEDYLGSLFNHDDTDTDRSQSSKLSTSYDETRTLWREAFGEEFVLSGAMYRGLSPVGRLAVMSPEQVSALLPREGTVNVESVVVDKPPANKLAISVNGRAVGRFGNRSPSQHASQSATLSGSPLVTVAFKSTADETLMFELKHGALCQCFAFRPRNYQYLCSVLQFLPNDGGEVGDRRPFRLQRQLRKTTLHLEGYVLIESLGQQTVLDVERGAFVNVAMPEPADLLWGPTPIGSLPPGASITCLVATHRLYSQITPNSFSALSLSVRIIHSLPLLMSAIQVFADNKMVALAHLVGPDQVPDSRSSVIGQKEKTILLNCRVGERCLVIKNSRGDWGFVFGSWANMIRGVPASSMVRAVRGNPGNLQVRFVRLREDLSPVTVDITRQQNFIFSVQGTELNLVSGQMKLSSDDVAERVALAFSVAVLNVLCQPPPPGSTTPGQHGHLGPASAPTVRPPPELKRGQRRISYHDAGSLELVAAAGWMMSTPCNHYLEACKHHGRAICHDNDGGTREGGCSDSPWAGSAGLDLANICVNDFCETSGHLDTTTGDCNPADGAMGADASAGCGGCGSSCGGGGGGSSCGGGGGGGGSSCGGGGGSSCGGGGGSSCGGGGSSCGGGGSSCGGGGS